MREPRQEQGGVYELCSQEPHQRKDLLTLQAERQQEAIRQEREEKKKEMERKRREAEEERSKELRRQEEEKRRERERVRRVSLVHRKGHSK